jgi:aspartyl protease family protein
MYLIVMCFLGLFGCLASNLTRMGSTFQSHARASGPSRDGAVMIAGAAAADVEEPSLQSYGNAIVLQREGDGHFYADVEINGATINMLVDTGASSVALSEADARRAGIATTIGLNDYVGEGAGGAVMGNMVTIDHVRLGDVEASHLEGVVLRGGDMSLLGQSFLREFASVEIAGDRMILR